MPEVFLLEEDSDVDVNFSTSCRTFEVDSFVLGVAINGRCSALLHPTHVIDVLQLLKACIHCAMNRVSTPTVCGVEGLQPSITPVET